MSKVAIVRCDDYDFNLVKASIERGLDLIGGLENIIPKSDKILLKPNLLFAKKPDKAVTTHPVVFKAIVDILINKGYTNLKYGDSPGIGSLEKVAKVTGISEIAEQYGLEQAVFDKGRTVSFHEGRIIKQFEMSEAALEADSIISLPKMKTHQLTRVTGAIKNQLGCIYGFNKASYHAKLPSAVEFSKFLVDLNLYLRPKLFIMDGILAMEGNGPGSGDPVKMNCLLISTDPVAIDSVFCRLVNIDYKFIPSIMQGKMTKLGVCDDEEIEIVGEDVRSMQNVDFNVIRKPVIDENFNFAKRLRRLILRKPYVLKEKCVKCGNCVEACPLQSKAISLKDKHSIPKYDYDLCIRCYCCQEMCPQKAIIVKTPLLGKILLRN